MKKSTARKVNFLITKVIFYASSVPLGMLVAVKIKENDGEGLLMIFLVVLAMSLAEMIEKYASELEKKIDG